MPKHDTVIHWFRRDLRLTDNPALSAAAKASEQVVPVYVLSDWKKDHAWTGSIRQQFLCGCLDSLAKNLHAIDSRLILRTGRADLEIEKLIKETKATAVYFNRDYDPYGREMEKKVQAVCARHHVECLSFKDRVLHEAEEVLTGDGGPYRVFTPYSRNWLTKEKTEAHGRLKSLGPAKRIPSDELPTLEHWKLPATDADLPAPGEKAARERMKDFIENGRLMSYLQRRDIPAGLSTSRLGQDLRFGLISIRELYTRCSAAMAEAKTPNAHKSIETYIKELAWREFYMAILWKYPEVFEEEFAPEFRGMPWPGTDKDFEAWSQGKTGFPIVDAGMRQMLATGFMHNRVRMIVSMFLTKDLHCYWKQGESFFMQHLVDGENASNNGGWQWSAGTGADAAPYFRIQNPWTQTKNYDPEGLYIRQWVPELREVSPARFLAPPKDGKALAKGYPLPIVDHSEERDRTLAIFAKHRGKH
ncbi:cryptochrome/photolyase family protein [Brevifollis gellanilyticus]|uniref:Deoxyribodipyrimidine photo-lyase n=1 Tax=Brevifollis gellanilyticus TaxID=748831 RepID=A0A512M8G5_9BACT|nr:deoxyribodipyrimidine photo-lyase [Brevifollis gellanilyticus]GEP43012.1 deoxyribodipyrimidine photo-lyase [Brevifollis gellanilyticus]